MLLTLGAGETANGVAAVAVPAAPVPAVLVAVTPQLYEEPPVIPLTVIGLPTPVFVPAG
jgi:hypothetical protein